VRIFTENQVNERTGILTDDQSQGKAPGKLVDAVAPETNSQSRTSGPSSSLAAILAVSALIPCAWGLTSAAAQTAEPASQTQSTQQAQFGNTSDLCTPEVIGNRRIPKESVLARLFSHQGNLYDPAIVERDFNSLWNTGYFEDVRIERVDTPACVQLVIYVKEKPTIREINYTGLNAVSLSDVAERLKKEKVGLTQESQYDPTRVKRAEVVLKDLLAEHGHQFATIKTEVKTIPPAAVAITFKIKEGPTVKVGKILFDGNQNLSDRTLRNAMVNLKPIGIPHSIILEDLFARTFDASKLDEDGERVRQAYRDRGYFKAITLEPKTKIRTTTGFNPLLFKPTVGKKIDILIPVEEGERYRLGGITFVNNKAVSNTRVLRAQFAIKDGDFFNATLFSKGLDNLRKAYGAQGYINFTGVPTPHTDEAKKLVYLEIDCQEGKQFRVARIEFQGNTITRDKVIRRELLLEEGQTYNSQLWDLSLLRLNQLNYFEPLKADQDSESRQNADDGTVDLLLKLKEKGKNSIGLNGGLSGLSGTFIGLNYETNNFLGLGETLSLVANIGDLSRNLTFGFTEPYLRNKPISLGVQVFDSKYDYNPAKAYSATGQQSANLSAAQNSQFTNYNTSTKGVTLSLSEPLRHLFARTGVTRAGASYSLSRSTVTTFNQNTQNVFASLAFRSGVAGQNQLNGIVTSVITPTFSFSSLDRAVGPHNGKDFSAQVQLAGVGGNVKYYSPAIAYRQFFPMKGLKRNREGHNVLGYRLQLAHTAGYGGEVAPPQNRIYGGGESDVRGFDIRASSPYVFIPNKILFNLTNPDGNTVPINPTQTSEGNVQIPLPVYRLVSIGGDTQFTSNVEYRIPIVNQVTFAFFTDFGMTFNTQASQLRQSVAGTAIESSPSYGCPVVINGACYGGQHINFSQFLSTVPGTNYVPRMSSGAELQVILPVVNAPFRIYYAYNPLRLYKSVPQRLALPLVAPAGDPTAPTFRSLFPNTDAGDFSYEQAVQYYGANYVLREPRKTFRITVSTTF
jgi:outer membrane protein insertion porin family